MRLEFKIPDLGDLKKSYDEDGYNHVPELFSPADMDILNKEFSRYIKDCVPKMKAVSYTHLTLPTIYSV